MDPFSSKKWVRFHLTNTKGYVFEYFIREILKGCGFEKVNIDNEILYESTSGIMIHGLGQSHNADVLVEPLMQVPFFYPSRMLVECKCYTNKLGIEFVRNVLGLRTDINNFDIVTPEILENRRNYRRNNNRVYNYTRYFYQVVLASISDFTIPAQEFAVIHKIPIISFDKISLFEPIKAFILRSDDYYDRLSEDKKKKFLEIIRGKRDFTGNQSFGEEIDLFFISVQERVNNMQIGILEDGTTLFLFKEEIPTKLRRNILNDTFELFWANNMRSWRIETSEYNYYFELPGLVMKRWLDQEIENQQKEALRIKDTYFSKITVYGRNNDYQSIKTLKISREFMQRAARELANNLLE